MEGSRTTQIDKNVLVSIYKTFKLEPNKVFVVSELLSSNSMNTKVRDNYLPTLKMLGLIEEVKAITVMHNGGKRKRRGYKLLK